MAWIFKIQDKNIHILARKLRPFHYARIDEKSQIALHAKMPYIFENYTQMWTFWHKDWIHMCTRSQNTQYSLNKFKFFTNKKNFFANYFLILRPGLLNKISIFFISRVIKFLKIWVPNRPKIEILFTKLVLRNKKCLMKKKYLFMKIWNLFSKNWVFLERVHIWIQFLRQNVETGV